jgi:hypothetical protein
VLQLDVTRVLSDMRELESKHNISEQK